MKYDLQGNRTELNDPDAGVITSKYNGWGELEWTEDPNFVTTQYDYNPASGLLNFVKCGDETTNYLYDDLNRLQEISIAGQHSQTFTYDKYDRITKVTEKIGDELFDISTGYDRYGRVVKETYPSGYYTENQYDDYGYLIKITGRSNHSIWEAVEANAYGQLTRIRNGAQQTSFDFDSKGLLTSIRTTAPTKPDIMNWSYIYDKKGNMVERKDACLNQRESMEYDEMNRLAGWVVYHGNEKSGEYSMSYSPAGNIEKKSDLDNLTMNYGENGKPHALTSISGIPGHFPANDLEITYTGFRKIKTLSEIDQNEMMIKSYELTYGVDGQRRKSVYKKGGTGHTRYYVGNYEEEDNSNGNIRKIHYLHGGGILIQENGQESLFYGHTDHLGSLTVLTDQSGNITERYAYDPWGNRRDPYYWANPDTRGDLKLNRGFTGHEHIDQFGIINMNGRVYDPLTSQFLSPDPYVQAPGNWLNYNRYGYCLNNPMMYTDPDGEIFEWIAVGFILYFVNAKANTPKGKDANKPKNWQWNPIKWFSRDGNGVIVNLNANTDGDLAFSAGVGNPNGPIPVAGYSNNNGAGLGIYNNGNTSLYYPGYDYTESVANKAVKSPSKPKGDSRFFSGDYHEASQLLVYLSKRDGVERAMYETELGYYFEYTDGYVFRSNFNAEESNTYLGKRENGSFIYHVENERRKGTAFSISKQGESLYLKLGMGGRYRVSGFYHTHPGNSCLSPDDPYQGIPGIRVKAIGWNGYSKGPCPEENGMPFCNSTPIKINLMKRSLILLSVCMFVLQSYSQETDDFVSIFRNEDEVVEFGPEENWENMDLYKAIISNTIDSIVTENTSLITQKICDKLVIHFIIHIDGKIDSCRIKESIDNEIENLILNAICNLEFKDAPIYDVNGKPKPLYCSLPIQFHNCLPIDRKKKNSINKTQ